MRSAYLLLAAVFCLAGCEPSRDANHYGSSEVGVSRAVEFGTILSVRPITIYNDERGTGALLGAAAGAGGASYIGSDSGAVWATVGGALAGAVVGDMVEQAATEKPGYEYVIEMQEGGVKTIALEKSEQNPAFKPGDKVMLQSCDAGDHYFKCFSGAQYQGLIPVDHFPASGKKNTTSKSHKK